MILCDTSIRVKLVRIVTVFNKFYDFLTILELKYYQQSFE